MSWRSNAVRLHSAIASTGIALVLVAAPAGPGAQADGEDASTMQSSEEKKMIGAGSAVGIEYTLTLEDGTTMDSNVGGEALRFQQGAGQIIPGLDKELIGMAVGDRKKVTVAPEEGYGPTNPEAFTEVSISELPEDARQTGAELMARDSEGNTQQLVVHKIDGDVATLDFNHPLAGKTLYFEIVILEID